MDSRVTVTFEPSGITASVVPGTLLLDAAKQAGVAIAAPCGGRGVCGSCGVRVLTGSLEAPDAEELSGLRRAPNSVRLACRARVAGPVTIRPLLASPPSASGEHAEDGSALVIGVDLGTTSVQAAAVELDGGRHVASGAAVNRQGGWGADVLSRLSAALEGEAPALQKAAEDSVADAIEAAGVSPSRVVRTVIAGNSAMGALFAGVAIAGLATAPFEAPSLPRHTTTAAGEPEVLLVPAIAGFVGGDTLAGLLHTGMLYADEPTLLVDLGTNAEIALSARGRLYVASAAAGPAFEGVGMECGGPAVPGSVSAVSFSGASDLSAQTVGDAPPCWLNGAGIISALALLRRLGHLSPDGLLRVEGPLASRVARGKDGVVRAVLGHDAEGEPIVISQLDIRSAQLAKAAVQVAITAVLRAARVRASDLAEVKVAGAFGGALAAEDLTDIGLLPAGTAARTSWVGNASLQGAVEFALDPALLDEAATRASSAAHIDLAGAVDFNDRMIAALELIRFEA